MKRTLSLSLSLLAATVLPATAQSATVLPATAQSATVLPATAQSATAQSAKGAALGSTLDKVLAALREGEYPVVLEIAAEVGPEHADYARIQYVAGETLLAVGDAAKAQKAFTATLESRPEAVPALIGLGRSYVMRGEFDEAEIHLGAALELEVEDAGARRAFGELRMAQGEMDEARGLLEEVYEADPKHPKNARAMVEFHLRANELDIAAKLASKFEKAHKKHPMGPFLQGVILERRARTEQAIQAYSKALELDENYLDAHKNLAILGHTTSDTYQIQARNELALAHYERYFELGGKDPQLERLYVQMKGFLASSGKAGGGE